MWSTDLFKFIASILDFLTNLNTQVFDLARIIYFVAVYVALQFQFVNSFLSLFYIAFYLQDMQLLKDVSLIQFFYIFFIDVSTGVRGLAIRLSYTFCHLDIFVSW